MMFLPLADKLNLSDAFSYSGFGFILVLAVLAVLAIFVKLLSSALAGKKKDPTEEVTKAPVASAAPVVAEEAPADTAPEAPEIPYIPGYVVLDGVSEQDAAVIMAITSHKTGTDLNRLAFKSIKRLNQDPVLENIEEQDAAAIMAITSDKTGIPLENLIFNSIKRVD